MVGGKRSSVINVLLVDDHTLFREGLKKILETEREINVLGEAKSGAEVLDFLAKKNAKKIDVVILDLNLPDMNGIQITQIIKDKFPQIKILILSVFDDEANILQAFNAGVEGYTVKTMSSNEIVTSIKYIARGEIVVPRKLTEKLVSGIRRISGEDIKRRIFNFTRREIEILTYLADGFSNKEIASKLKTKEKTVKNQMNIIFDKLGVRNRTQAVLKAIKTGIISGK